MGPRQAQGIMLLFLILALGIYFFQPKQSHPPETGALRGIKNLNVAELGPWVVQPTGVLTKPDPQILGITEDLRSFTQDRLKQNAISVQAKGTAPKLKLLLNYGNDQTKLALRGTRQLDSLKLVLEDDVDLNRQPPQVVPLVTWSASIDTSTGSGSSQEIRAGYENLLNMFLKDLNKSDSGALNALTLEEHVLVLR